jgi:DeoR/GlpR family transcriptional regulator of sugar metabolism
LPLYIFAYLFFVQSYPNLRISDAARLLNVSRQTIYSYLEQLETAGKIRRTDQGVEVLE